MPSWKKVILSGSDAALNSLAVSTNVTASSFTGSFTGSLQGTASFAVTASYVATASYTPNLQQVTTQGNITNNSIVISGSQAGSSLGANLRIHDNGFIISGSLDGPSYGVTHQVIYNAISVAANSTTTISQLPAPRVAGFTFDYVAYVGVSVQAGRAGVVKGILRSTGGGARSKGFHITETTTLDLEDQGFGTAGLQFTIVQDTNGTSNQLVAITNNNWGYEIIYTLTIYNNPLY